MRRNLSAVRGLLLVALLTVAALLAVTPGRALADGDPGSDVLIGQNLFPGGNISDAQQVQLGKLLNATAAAGAPVRVAIIGAPEYLGYVTGVWRRPQLYASSVLGYELSGMYSGRLLVVMPNGYGVWWAANKAGIGPLSKDLARLGAPGASSSDLVAATRAAVLRIERAAGISAAKLAALGAGSAASAPATSSVSQTTPAASTDGSRTASAGTSSSSHHRLPTGIFALVLVLIATGYVAFRRGWRPRLPERPIRPEPADGEPVRRRFRVRPVALLPTLLLVIVLAALAINQHNRSTVSQADALEQNAGLDPGTSLSPKPAPNFTLDDQSGQPVSLSQYRGKVVILSFVDAECQTLCPLTTQAMLDAKTDLGPAAKDVQLLGVNANWLSTSIEDVANYTQAHGLSGQWQFLTAPRAQLSPVWTAYGVNELTHGNEAHSTDIEHVASTYIIDPEGRMRDAFLTYSNYTSIPQLGQRLAQKAAALLPSHPAVHSDLSYAAVPGIAPTQATTLPRAGGGTVTLGPGKAHLYLFFDTWDAYNSPIANELDELNSYRQQATRLGLPDVTAVDEGSVEPSASALPAFLKTLAHPLTYPVAIDESGRVADGYEVEGEPWLVLVNPAGKIVWYREVYTNGWPKPLGALELQVKAALKPSSAPLTPASLNGSPPVLAALHSQASQLLGGGVPALYQRLAKLSGHPIVLNIWGSWCQPCQDEFGYFQQASLAYGKQVAFLGADFKDQSGNAAAFLRQHRVYYPSYVIGEDSPYKLLPGGITGTPTTIFITASGQKYVYADQIASLGALEGMIEQYALGGS